MKSFSLSFTPILRSAQSCGAQVTKHKSSLEMGRNKVVMSEEMSTTMTAAQCGYQTDDKNELGEW
ncbi:hypothetical protein J6590_086661 [Homalodisca vitripennis]|nr:hypothetical protein J6590_086661 [Homalodisca vitripennis]